MAERRIRIGQAEGKRSVLEALREQGEYVFAPCGGNGICGKCKVRFLGEDSTGLPAGGDRAADGLSEGFSADGWAGLPAGSDRAADGLSGGFSADGRAGLSVLASGEDLRIPAPSEADLRLLAPQEIADGVRLACTARAVAGAVVELVARDESGMEAAASFSLGENPLHVHALQEGVHSDENPDARGKISPEDAGRQAGSVVAAVDIGTTTIAMAAVDAGSGQVLGTVTGINHQRAFGADVISRIEASNRGEGGRLQDSILADLHALRARLGLPEDVPMVVSGNTTMEHLLQAMSCKSLGVAPYTPVDISLHKYENMVILPGISTFVGADIVSGIVACGMDRSEEVCILVDLGTNGEMAIGNRDRIVTASTAAGPAFEGGNIRCGIAGIPGAISGVEIEDGVARLQTIGGRPPAGLCGTGVLEVVYELLQEGLMDETGLLDDDYFEDGFPLAEGIVFTGKDVREVQLAKSAIRAGLEVLLRVYGTDYGHVGRLYIAGGFGQKTDLAKAAGIGLLPEELLDRAVPVGNSSLAGAIMAACDPALGDLAGVAACTDPDFGPAAAPGTEAAAAHARVDFSDVPADAILARMQAVGHKAGETALAENPLFSDLYMDHMFFPEPGA